MKKSFWATTALCTCLSTYAFAQGVDPIRPDDAARNTQDSFLKALDIKDLDTVLYAQTATNQGRVTPLSEVVLLGTEDPTGPVDGFKAKRSSSGTRINSELDELPVSVDVISDAVIEATNATRVETAVLAATGAAVGNTFGGVNESFIIRGFDANVADNGNLTGFFDIQVRDSANAERIEVLSGPAGALFGFGPPGGVINVITKKPQDRLFLDTKTEVSTFTRVRQEIDVNVPVAKEINLNTRFVAAFEGSDSFRFRDAFDETFPENRIFLAPSLSFEPFENFNVLLRGQYLRDSRIFDRGIPILLDGSAASEISDFFGDASLDPFIVQNLVGDLQLDYEINKNWSVSANFSGNRNERDGFSLETEAFLEEPLTVGPIPPFLPVPLEIIPGGLLLRQLEFRDQGTSRLVARGDINGSFSTGFIDHEVVASVERFSGVNDSELSQSGFLPPAGDAIPLSAVAAPTTLTEADLTILFDTKNDTDTLSFSFFDKLSYKDTVHILGGGRVDILDQSIISSGVLTDTVEVTEFSPRVGIVVKPLENKNFSSFFSYGESFEPNTVLAVGGGILDPELGRTFEGGLSYDFRDGAFNLAVTAFDITLENAPLSIDGVEFVGTTNSSRGVELRAKGAITDNLDLISTYTFVDSELLSGGELFDVAEGESVVGVPKHTVTFLAQYSFREDSILDGLSLTGSLRFQGARLLQNTSVALIPLGPPLGTIETLLPSIELNPTVRIDIGAQYERHENFVVEFGIQNLLNDEIIRPSAGSAVGIPEAGIVGFGAIKIKF
ncbi:MAG: TonB-dependent receptor [Pseudomonadota bacterium]